MKILLIGSDGFIGRSVQKLLSVNHSVYSANRTPEEGEQFIDLLDKDSIATALKVIRPEIIINCAGVVENNEAAKNNVAFTKNIIAQIHETGIRPQRVIISGSAAVYGVVRAEDLPVNEDVPLNANSEYGLSKLEEEKIALRLGEEYGLDVVVARIFNPIGSGMHPRFLIPRIISQLNEINDGNRQRIEVNRLDASRDYIDVKDIAAAIMCLIERKPLKKVYNIGSGNSTSNEELIRLIIKHSKTVARPEIIETSKEPEPLVAIQADISRLSNEFDWLPKNSVEDVIKEIMNAK